MKKIALSILTCFIVFSFFSCKKDSGGGGSTNYYIKANVGGTEKNYTVNPIAASSTVDGTYFFQMAAFADASSKEGLSLQVIKNTGAVTAADYKAFASSDVTVASIYNPGTDATNISALFASGYSSEGTPLDINITSITNSTVSGTFSGEYFDNSGTGTDSLLISNGEFNLPIK